MRVGARSLILGLLRKKFTGDNSQIFKKPVMRAKNNHSLNFSICLNSKKLDITRPSRVIPRKWFWLIRLRHEPGPKLGSRPTRSTPPR